MVVFQTLHYVVTTLRLGVILDRQYTMSQQVSKIIQSSTYKLRLINVIRTKLTKPVAERVVNAMVTNNLDYCNSLLYGISGHQRLRIQRIQNTAARQILHRDRWSSARNMLNELHWLSMRKRIRFKVLLVLYEAMHGLTPDNISVLATPYVPLRYLRSANDNLLVVPKTQLHYGDITFTVAATKMWNKLPAVIKLSGNVDIFKKNVKTHYLPKIGTNRIHNCFPVCVLCNCLYNHCIIVFIVIMYVIFNLHGLEHMQFYTAH